MSLVLSLFPGIGLLDMAFEEEGFCVVRGPDLLWGGDIKRFHPPAGRFDGVIGGPPCQKFSGLANFAYRWARAPEDLIPEYERVILEAAPAWFVMENVPAAPTPKVDGYTVQTLMVDNRWFGEEQARKRAISFGSRDGLWLSLDGFAALENPLHAPTVTASHGGGRPRMKGRIKSVPLAEALRLQGCPSDFFGPKMPWSVPMAQKMIVQGVPLAMGRAVARAVREAISIRRAA